MPWNGIHAHGDQPSHVADHGVTLDFACGDDAIRPGSRTVRARSTHAHARLERLKITTIREEIRARLPK